jgi:hypothetical protein
LEERFKTGKNMWFFTKLRFWMNSIFPVIHFIWMNLWLLDSYQ